MTTTTTTTLTITTTTTTTAIAITSLLFPAPLTALHHGDFISLGPSRSITLILLSFIILHHSAFLLSLYFIHLVVC
ncbi:hypothetical protein E2C01_094759 [Portunus trituberculatus]|uniref:Uncharacterized protein n=1 Tax=Portunus trituberculatus TaxID=210409 RepID=A0A5B7JRA1_PORTR|nr:hypothetical protein [Portunus trituberculatus]